MSSHLRLAFILRSVVGDIDHLEGDEKGSLTDGFQNLEIEWGDVLEEEADFLFFFISSTVYLFKIVRQGARTEV